MGFIRVLSKVVLILRLTVVTYSSLAGANGEVDTPAARAQHRTAAPEFAAFAESQPVAEVQTRCVYNALTLCAFVFKYALICCGVVYICAVCIASSLDRRLARRVHVGMSLPMQASLVNENRRIARV